MTTTKIIKRSGDIVPFDQDKITIAIFKAAKAVGGSDFIRAKELSGQVVAAYQKNNKGIPTVEEIQDIVEEVLIESGHAKTAKAYILYRQQRTEIRNFQNLMLNSAKMVQEYLGGEDWRINENSNMNYSLQGLNNHIITAVTSKYWLEKVYPQNIRDAHRFGDFHIHDLSLLAPYCCGWNLEDILLHGFRGAPQKTSSAPAKHFRAALGQIVNFFYTLQGEAAGAQALSSFDTYLSPFIRYDNLSYRDVEQAMQEFIFNLNVPTRVGFQSPFINITMDVTVPGTLANQPAIIGGQMQKETYGEFQEEMNLLNKAFCKVMMAGDSDGRIFTFPIPTYNVTNDFFENPVIDEIMEMTAKYGIPYFANFINSDLSPEDVRSMCPLTSDTKVLVKSKHRGVRISSIGRIVYSMKTKNTVYYVWTNNGWKKAKPVKMPMTDVYKITFTNGMAVKMGENHLQPILGGEVLKARNLQEGMWLPFNKKQMDTNIGGRELGYAVGAYLGDGSRNEKAIVYSLSTGRKSYKIKPRLINFWREMGFKVADKRAKNNVVFLRVNGNSYDIIKKYVGGECATSKFLTDACFDMSMAFKDGLMEGFRDTDGSAHKKRLYTSSAKLRESICVLLSSMGRKYMAHYEDNRENRLGKNTNYRIDCPGRSNYGNYYMEDQNYHYYRVEEIEKIDCKDKYLYCFEVDTDDHLFMLANGLMTHNCRLRLDTRELQRRGGGLFGANPMTGSIGVVTINLPRIGYKAIMLDDYMNRLTALAELAKESLLIKRDVLEQLTKIGLYPYSRFYLDNVHQRFGRYWDNHFNTIGIVGMNESILNYTRQDITTPLGQEMAKAIIDHLRKVLVRFQKETGQMFNLEATPAESTAYRLALLDKELYPDIITAGEKEPYYTNSTQLPVDAPLDLFEALGLQDELQTKYTGGTVFHAYLGERLDDLATCKKIIKRILSNYHLPYVSLTPTFSICEDHGYLNGEQFTCPYCQKETEVWSRVVGFYRPVQNWNKGKEEEYKERKVWSI